LDTQVQALADYTFVSKYAKYLPEKERRETWSECIDRSKSMHEAKYSHAIAELRPFLDEAFDSYHNKLAIGSQRNLQFAGHAVVQHNARSYNCCGSYCDRPRFFQEAMYNLLCGTGVGFSVQRHHVAKLPNLDLGEKTEIIPYEIEDSIEGWAESIGVLVNSYFENGIYPEYQGKVVKFVYNKIRPKGSLFSHGIGRAPGFEPLRNTHKKIRNLLDECVARGQTKLRPIDAYDIVMHASDAVLSGGIRRSATICIFSVDDEEMMNAKTGNWFIDNPQRGRSNNSALLLKNQTTPEQFRRLMQCTKQYGEPGFYWADSTEIVPNPCVSGETMILTDRGSFRAKDLVGKKFNAIVDGKIYPSTDAGFVETGYQPTFTIRTEEGYEISATHNHAFLDSSGAWTIVDQLNVGDTLMLNNHSNHSWQGNLNFETGWLLGNLIGDGFVSEETAVVDYWNENCNDMRDVALEYLKSNDLSSEHVNGYAQTSTVEKVRVESRKLKNLAESYGIVHGNKILDSRVESLSYDAYRGFLRGYFDADGSVQGTSEKGTSIRLTSVILENLQTTQRMLLRLGIASKIFKNRRCEGVRKIKGIPYHCKAIHELVVSKDMIERFAELIGFHDANKQNRLNEIVASRIRAPYCTKFQTTIASITRNEPEAVYDCTIPGISAFDANGFMSHNCVEIGFWCYDDRGNSGWQFCNLSSMNGGKITSANLFRKAARAAAIIGTLQAGYTSFPYLGEVTERIVKREALLGVSITGIMESPSILLDPKLQKEVAQSLIEVNRAVSAIIGINPAARITCIKPEGSTSCMLGTSSGIHPHHAKRYIRRVQANKMEAPAQYFMEHNPRAVEESSWSANKTDYCISFACEIPTDKAVFKKDVNAIQMLMHVKSTQENWVEYGKNPSLCTQPWLSHNVSNTIVVKPEEWDAVESFIYDNRQYFAGVSLLGSSGDKDYTQAPFTEVLTPEEIVKEYGPSSILASGIIEDAMVVYGDLWAACSTALGYGEDLREKKVLDHEEQHRQRKLDWIARLKKFAKNYHANDLVKSTYLLKDVYNWKLWYDISKTHKRVDYSKLIEQQNSTVGTQEVACGGGGCLT
jgi:ribonucleotide reductase class II